MEKFKYKKFIGIVRSPFTTMGSMHNARLKGNKGLNGAPLDPLQVIRYYVTGNMYLELKQREYADVKNMRRVRLEDLKLYPKETTEKMCEFLRIPWSETCMHITTNGEDSGVVDGTAGFDIKPIYNPHSEHLSSFDYYRVELLNYKKYNIWGYKMKYYDGAKFSREELKKMYCIPFKIETQKLIPYPDWPNEQVSKEFHEWILARAIDVMENGEKDFVDNGRKSTQQPEILFPDLKPGQKLFE